METTHMNPTEAPIKIKRTRGPSKKALEKQRDAYGEVLAKLVEDYIVANGGTLLYAKNERRGKQASRGA